MQVRKQNFSWGGGQPYPANGLGERCEVPQQGLGWSPSRDRIWCILDLKYDICWQEM